MDLFDFEKQEPAENSVQAQASEEGQSVLQLIIMVAVGIILVVLLVLFARWVYHKAHHVTQTTNTSSNQAVRSFDNPGSSQPANNSQPSTNSGSSSSGSNSSAATTQNGPLPNSGPGNVAAIFAGSALAAAGLHYIISLRRFNKNGS